MRINIDWSKYEEFLSLSLDAPPTRDQLNALLVDAASQRAFQIHPYGFLVLKLGEVGKCYELRLHVWLANFRPRQEPDWPPHTHPGHFHSFILEGVLKNQIWNVEEKVHGSACLYNVSYKNSKSVLTNTGIRVDCIQKKTRSYSSGECYTIIPGQYHSIDVEQNSLAITTTLMEKTNFGEFPHVVGEFIEVTEIHFERMSLEANRQAEAFSLVREIFL